MPRRKTLLFFFIMVGVLYALLLIPWPGVMSGYRKAVVATSNLFMRSFGSGLMTYELMDKPTLDKDITVNVKNTRTGSMAKMSLNARRSYLPVAFTASLILAAPIPWRRKILSLVLGLILINVFIQFGFWLKIVHLLSEPRFAAMELGQTTRNFLLVLIKILTMSPVVPYIVALLVFVLVTVRRDDLVRLSVPSSLEKATPGP